MDSKTAYVMRNGNTVIKKGHMLYHFHNIFKFYSDPVESRKPSAPRNLEVVEVSKDCVTVTWQTPKIDGNSPITRYVVEKADVDGHTFTTAGCTDSDTLRLNVSQLDKDKHYMVRVFAENAIGQSEPVCLSEPISLLGEYRLTMFCCATICAIKQKMCVN